MILATLAAVALAAPGYSSDGRDLRVCSRTMSFEDQYCDAVLIRRARWTHADAAAAHERAARYALPKSAAISFVAAANNWIAAGDLAKAVVAFDRALAADLNETDRKHVLAARHRTARLVSNSGEGD